jgi:hypothetical protein
VGGEQAQGLRSKPLKIFSSATALEAVLLLLLLLR